MALRKGGTTVQHKIKNEPRGRNGGNQSGGPHLAAGSRNRVIGVGSRSISREMPGLIARLILRNSPRNRGFLGIRREITRMPPGPGDLNRLRLTVLGARRNLRTSYGSAGLAQSWVIPHAIQRRCRNTPALYTGFCLVQRSTHWGICGNFPDSMGSPFPWLAPGLYMSRAFARGVFPTGRAGQAGNLRRRRNCSGASSGAGRPMRNILRGSYTGRNGV